VNLPVGDPRTPRLWRLRVEDRRRILDQLDLLEAAVPGLTGASTEAASPRPVTPSAARRRATSSACAAATR
jgi:hypothetical protein